MLDDPGPDCVGEGEAAGGIEALAVLGVEIAARTPS